MFSSYSLFVWLATASLFSVTDAASFQIINADGACRSEMQVNKYFETCGVVAESPLDVVDVIDCTGDNDVSLVNEVFGTSFTTGNGISLELKDSTALLYSSFSRMFSNKMCGSKAVDYQCSLPGSLCVTLKALDLDSTMKGHEQVFRRLLNYAHGKQGGSAQDLLFIVDETGIVVDDAGSSAIEYATKVESYLQSLWTESFGKKDSLKSALALKVLTVRSEDAAAVEQVRAAATEWMAATATAKDAASSLVQKLPARWNSLPATPVAVLSPKQREALYSIEAAYTAGLAQIDVAVSQWQSRIASGRTVGQFANRAEQLLGAVKRDFNMRVSGAAAHGAVRERGERLRQLSEHVTTAAARLFRQQLLILEFRVTNSFRRDLTKLIASSSDVDVENMEAAAVARKEAEQAVLRRAIFDYKSQASELENEAVLGLSLSENQVNELQSALEQILREFPESPAAKLEEVRKVEKKARGKPQQGAGARRKKSRSLAKALGVSLSLVGMLRPPGYGNLQGFVGYATSMLGLPLDLLLGVQNDGDAPEIMGEDREYPILRVQPKMNFDINL